MGTAFVRGLQGDDLRDGVIATGKHFLAYGLAEGGRNLATAMVSDRELYEVFARPFEAAIRLAGLASIMNSYSEVNGEPPAGSRAILTDLLRGRLGFDGFVVSDYMAISMLANRQHTAHDLQDAGVQAIEAGLDVELPQEVCYGTALVDAVNKGLVGTDTMDASTRPVLAAKFRLGLFEAPYVDPDTFSRVAMLPVRRQLARTLAAHSVVLLKTRGGLSRFARTRAIAVIGQTPTASATSSPAGYTAAAATRVGFAVEHPAESRPT